MVATRAISKSATCANNTPKINIKEMAKKTRRGRGRPSSHDRRAKIAIGMKLRMPRLELEFTVDMVNCVCDNIVNSMEPAAMEGELCCRTLRKRVVALMNGATWSQLNATQHQSLWEGIVDDTIKDLVFEACDKILFEEERKEWENRNAIAAAAAARVANVALAPQEEGYNFNNNNQCFMLYPDQHVILDPPQPVQRQLFGGAVNDIDGAVHQFNFGDISSMHAAEMQNNTAIAFNSDGVEDQYVGLLEFDEELL